MGWAATAFLISYMVISPVFGWLADRTSRWLLVGIGVTLWSLASGGTGVAKTFAMLLVTRCFVGVGEAAYGPVAPTILSDLLSGQEAAGGSFRGSIWRFPSAARWATCWADRIAAHSTYYRWRMAFFAVVPPGLLLGAWALFHEGPAPRRVRRRRQGTQSHAG